MIGFPAKGISISVGLSWAILNHEIELGKICYPSCLSCSQLRSGLNVRQGIVVSVDYELIGEKQIPELFSHSPHEGQQFQLHARVIVHVMFMLPK